MSAFALHTAACERAREWASLDLDGELSEFERVLLRAHLDSCASCAAYTEKVTRTTDALRDAPLVAVGPRVALPGRRRPALALRAYQLAGATAVLIAAIGLGSTLGGPSSRPGSTAVVPPRQAVEGVAEDTLIRGPRLAMINAEKGVGPQRGLGIDI